MVGKMGGIDYLLTVAEHVADKSCQTLAYQIMSNLCIAPENKAFLLAVGAEGILRTLMWCGDNDLQKDGTLPLTVEREFWHESRKASALLTNVLWHADGEQFSNARNGLFHQVLSALRAAGKWKKFARSRRRSKAAL